MTMIERVARAIAFSAGAAIVGPGESRATRELGWDADGGHFQKYVERHWKEYEHAATFALEATAASITDRWGSVHPGVLAIRAELDAAYGQ